MVAFGEHVDDLSVPKQPISLPGEKESSTQGKSSVMESVNKLETAYKTCTENGRK